MAHEKERSPRFGILALLVGGAIIGLGLLILDDQAVSEPEPPAVARPDVLLIDALGALGDLERPPSLFKHDFHVDALQADSGERTCEKCHIEKDGAYSFKFMRIEDTGYDEVRDLYHRECVACHLEREPASAPGAESCNRCHQREPAAVSSRLAMLMDNSLHHRHTEAHEQKCDPCHHEYDEQAQKLVHVEGNESNCRDCHRSEPGERATSFRQAAHAACINCHLENRKGPSDCAGCHDADRRGAIARVEPTPRMKRDQPDAVLIHAGPEDLADSKLATVPFNHRDHEQMNTTCRVCHHEGISACRDCHTLAGDEKGGGVSLAIAMHAPNVDHSCVGCHETAKQKTGCAGCHELIPSKGLAEAFCEQCHSGPLPEAVVAAGNDRWPLKVPDPAQLALFSYIGDDVPDTVEIAHITDKYEPAVMPHRKIVEKLRGGIANSPLAVHAHGRDDLVCQGCHHHSPVGSRPPLCSNCHGEPFQPVNIHAPGLYGAYHQQCLSCHQAMELPTGCTDCHAERPQQALATGEAIGG